MKKFMKKLYIISLLALFIAPLAGVVSADQQKATVFHPISGERRVVTVGDSSAFDGGFLLETPENNFENLASERIEIITGTPEIEGGLLGYSVATRYRTTLKSSMTSSQATVPTASVTTFDDHVLTMADLGDVVYLTIEPGTSREEIVECTGISSTNWTGCTRGLAFYGTSTASVTANQEAHNAGSIVVMSNVHYVYEQVVDKDTSETITGLKKYSVLPETTTSLLATTTNQFVTKELLDGTMAAGISTSTESVFGGSTLATKTETASSTYDLLNPKVLHTRYSTSTPYSDSIGAGYICATEDDGNLSADCLPVSEDITWSGNNTYTGTSTFSGISTFSATTTLANLTIGEIASAMTASTTITGATLPQPVYMASSTASNAGAILLSDANDLDASDFIGFAITNASNGETVYVQQEGVVDGFSGLTPGAVYYVQDSVGTIGTTAGTYRLPIGKALSATQLLIDVQPFYLGTSGVSQGSAYNFTVPWQANKIVVSGCYSPAGGDSGYKNEGILTVSKTSAGLSGYVGGSTWSTTASFNTTTYKITGTAPGSSDGDCGSNATVVYYFKD